VGTIKMECSGSGPWLLSWQLYGKKSGLVAALAIENPYLVISRASLFNTQINYDLEIGEELAFLGCRKIFRTSRRGSRRSHSTSLFNLMTRKQGRRSWENSLVVCRRIF
jgi:hypothetical protein